MDLRRFYEEQLELIREGDVDGLVDRHYHPDAVLVTPQGALKGHKALKEMFRGYIPTLGDLVVTTETFVEADGVCLIEAVINPGPQSRRVYDVFVLRDDRIISHVAGVFH